MHQLCHFRKSESFKTQVLLTQDWEITAGKKNDLPIAKITQFQLLYIFLKGDHNYSNSKMEFIIISVVSFFNIGSYFIIVV